MRDILKNIICLLIINIIASIGSFAIILLVIAMFEHLMHIKNWRTLRIINWYLNLSTN